MKWWYLLFALPSFAAVIAAAILAYRQRAGWGWFLFVAFVLAPSITIH